MSSEPLRLHAGDLIEVKSRDEILATLDEMGCLDGMPFMPEMLKFCGRQLRVSKVAHKTCDTKCKTGGRSIKDCVHLEDSRCDGTGHDGCQAYCNLFWKTAWLRETDSKAHVISKNGAGGITVDALSAATRSGSNYRCQATQILESTEPLAWWDFRQYIQDVTSGNASAGTVVKILILSWFATWRRYGYPYRLSRWSYDRAHRVLTGRDSPYPPDGLDCSAKSPTGCTNLKPGDIVRIKSHLEIRKTLNKSGQHRGLWFDVEMVPYCGGEYRVTQRVEKIINEETGEMMQMKNPCIMLDGVVCRAECSDKRLFCPRAIPPYWREIWLERVEQEQEPPDMNVNAGVSTNRKQPESEKP